MYFELFCRYWNLHQVEVNYMMPTSRKTPTEWNDYPCAYHTPTIPLPLPIFKTFPWKPLESWGLLSTSYWGSLLVCLSPQSCPTFCDPMDCSMLGTSVHETLQARILEWVAIPFSRGSNLSLLHCRQILYHLSHQGSPAWYPAVNTALSFTTWCQ